MLRAILQLFKKSDSNPEVLRDYLRWREIIFLVTSGQGGVVTDQPNQVYGVMMDMGLSDQFVISITAFATGESSLRTTMGGGVVGLGSVEEIAEHAKQIVSLAQALVLTTNPIDNHNLPTSHKVFFYFLTTSGIRRSEFTSLKEIESDRHPFNEMFVRFTLIKRKSEQLTRSSQPHP